MCVHPHTLGFWRNSLFVTWSGNMFLYLEMLLIGLLSLYDFCWHALWLFFYLLLSFREKDILCYHQITPKKTPRGTFKTFSAVEDITRKEDPFQIEKPKSLISYLKYVGFAQFLDFCWPITVILQISTFTNKNNI